MPCLRGAGGGEGCRWRPPHAAARRAAHAHSLSKAVRGLLHVAVLLGARGSRPASLRWSSQARRAPPGPVAEATHAGVGGVSQRVVHLVQRRGHVAADDAAAVDGRDMSVPVEEGRSGRTESAAAARGGVGVGLLREQARRSAGPGMHALGAREGTRHAQRAREVAQDAREREVSSDAAHMEAGGG